MRLYLISLALLGGCATVEESPQQHALNSCFFESEQRGWHFDASPPNNAPQLRELIAASVKNDLVLQDRYTQYWFTHDDGRKFVCSLLGVGDLPNICGRAAYELTPSDDTWNVAQSDLILCTERIK